MTTIYPDKKSAKENGGKLFHGTRCKKCGSQIRYVNNGGCRDCTVARAKKWADQNADRVKQNHSVRYQNNKEKILAKNKKWAEQNREASNAIKNKYREKNPDKIKEIESGYRERNRVECNRRIRQWKQRNKHKAVAYAAARRARQLDQTPEDADQNAIEKIYKECRRISQETGIPHHVDHIVPLSKGGLHHQDNLQILTAEDNLKKSNKL